MSANDLLKDIYSLFYEQREVLSEAPQLLQDPTATSFDFNQADTELAKLISYMLGVEDVKNLSFDQAVEIVQKHYANQPEWCELLLNYLKYAIEREKENLIAEEEEILKEISEFTDKLLQEE